MNRIIKTDRKTMARLTVREICEALLQNCPDETPDVFIIYQRMDGSFRIATQTDEDITRASALCENCGREFMATRLHSGLCTQCRKELTASYKEANPDEKAERKRRRVAKQIAQMTPQERARLRRLVTMGER